MDADATVTAVYQYIAALQANWPPSPQQAGAILTVTFTFSNYGPDGVYVFSLKDASGVTLGSVSVSAAQNTTGNAGRINFIMPSSDAQITLTSDAGGYLATTIQVLISVTTTLTLTMLGSASPNQTVNFSGQLTRADGGAAGAQQIKILSGSTTYATANTDANGNFSGSFTAPATSGTYTFQASFAGSGYLSASLSAAQNLRSRPNR